MSTCYSQTRQVQKSSSTSPTKLKYACGLNFSFFPQPYLRFGEFARFSICLSVKLGYLIHMKEKNLWKIQIFFFQGLTRLSQIEGLAHSRQLSDEVFLEGLCPPPQGSLWDRSGSPSFLIPAYIWSHCLRFASIYNFRFFLKKYF